MVEMPATTHEPDAAELAEIGETLRDLNRNVRRGDGSGRYRGANQGLEKAPETLGEAFTRSGSYKGWTSRFPGGGPTARGDYQSDPVVIPGGLRSIVTSANASAGTLVPADYRGLIEPGLVRPLTLRQLVTVQTTDSDVVEYVRESGRISGAAPVTEALQVPHTGDVTATKPEGGITFAMETVNVQSFAEWVPATRRVVSDAKGLMGYIDDYLREDLALEVEDQIVAGTGGAGFTGLFNTTGTQTVGPPGAGESMLHVLRRALRLVQVNARTSPTAVLMSPIDAETLDLLQVAGEANHFLGDPFAAVGGRRVWGMPIVVSEACPVGFALVGDYRKAIVFDREETSIAIGTAGDDFIRNIVRVLAELRAGFAVIRPAAFVEVDLA